MTPRRRSWAWVGSMSVLFACSGGSNGAPSSDVVATSFGPSTVPATSSTTTTVPIPDDWEVLYAQLRDEYTASQDGKSLPMEYQFGPTVNRDEAEEAIAAYERATKPWRAIIGDQPVAPIVWAIMSEQDYAWWRELAERQEGPGFGDNWDPETDRLGHCSLTDVSFCGYTNQFRRETPEYRILQYSVIGSRYSGEPNANTVNHEATHWYQLSVTERFPEDLPCWYVEGQASLHGNALQYDVASQRTAAIGQRNHFKDIVRQYQPDADTHDEEKWIAVLGAMFQPHVSCGPTQDYFKYAVGMFNWEFLRTTYGSEVMHQILVDFSLGRTFAESATARLGVSPARLDEMLAGHLVRVFALNH